jgi:plasmid maintenance system killer protein
VLAGGLFLLILFSDKELAEACMNPQAGQRRWGKSVYTKIVKRLSEFGAAESLRDIATIKGARLEKLLGKRTGTMSVRVDDSMRIVFRTRPMPAPEKGEEILILEVIDYHE